MKKDYQFRHNLTLEDVPANALRVIKNLKFGFEDYKVISQLFERPTKSLLAGPTKEVSKSASITTESPGPTRGRIAW
jgi:hypothetical protein